MDNYLKWDCYDLADQRDSLEYCQRAFTELYEELLDVSRQLGQMEGTAPLHYALEVANEITHRLREEHMALDRCIDIYYAVESQIDDLIENLPATISQTSSPVTSSLAKSEYIPTTMATSGNELIMEGWLAALVHGQL